MDKKKLLIGIAEKTSKAFDIPGDVVGGLPRVTATAVKVNIENHRGLVEYGQTEITVNSSTGLVKIRGDNLELAAMSSAELVAKGKIYSVEFIA